MYIGLTGGIGAGKSTTLEIFRQLGWFCSDTDSMVHSLYKTSEKLQSLIKKRWDLDVDTYDHEECRKKIAEIVFKDKDELKWLESVIHPEVLAQMKLERDKYQYGICAVPLLFEKHLENSFDKVISLRCTDEVQKMRLRQRGWSDKESSRRLSCQLDMDVKAERADFVIENSGSLEILKTQCEIIDGELRGSR